MRRDLSMTLRPTVACSSCGERITVTARAHVTDTTPDSLSMSVNLDPDDRVWLDLFAEAHHGPIVST